MKTYALETGGVNYFLINADATLIDGVIENILTSGSIADFNQGKYSNTISFDDNKLPKTLVLENFVIPSGGKILFRYRTSTDNLSWTGWSVFYDASTSISFEVNLGELIQYMQYEVFLYGDEFFTSPTVDNGITFSYYTPQDFVTFFMPIDLDIDSDAYVSSIHISNKATIPDSSTISYGITQSDSKELDDYASLYQPVLVPERHSIVLTRYNEMCLTSNYKTYTAINGRWPKGASISVYRRNSSIPDGVLVSPSEFAANYIEGTLTFYNTQSINDEFLLNVELSSSFRIICNVVNYGPEAAIVDHIGIMYNIMKRVPRDNDGNIVHKNIRDIV